jgi:6-phosphogluconolactonase (cycloisomerase 2 family)
VTVTENPLVISYYPAGCTISNKAAGIVGDCICVQDTNTHDVWLAKPDSAFKIWQEAYDWAISLNDIGICGIYDWGLPTKTQLDTMAGYVSNIKTSKNEWFNNNGFVNIDATSFYWGLEASAAEAWALEMSLFGGVWPVDKHITNGRAWAVYSPSTTYAYVTNSNSNTVSMYSVNPNNGKLIPLKPKSTIETERQPFNIAFEPSGHYAYVANASSGTISMYSIGSNGELIPLTPSTVATGVGPAKIIFEPSGKYAYVINYLDHTISMYSLGSDGKLTTLSPESTIATGTEANNIIFDPTGSYAYVATGSNTNGYIYTYSLNHDTGMLTPASDTPIMQIGGNPSGMVFSSSGKFVYIVKSGGNSVAMYSFDAGSGKLSPLEPITVTAGTVPTAITFGGSGNFAYVSNRDTNDIFLYNFNADNGQLILNASTKAKTGIAPTDIKFDPSGNFAYVVNSNSNTVSVYNVDDTNGTLTPTAEIATEFLPTKIEFRTVRISAKR